MSSILASLKQRPVDTQYFTPLSGTSLLQLNIFTPNTNNSTSTYVSGAAAGTFTASNITAAELTKDSSGVAGQYPGVPLFRDMGITIVSSARTFRAVQLLQTDGLAAGGWTSSNTTAGVWKASVEGILGLPATTSPAPTGLGVYYFETGARGLGIAQGLVRYG
uniref:Uncharacterized protein n=1 Tax=viral metagenome TaxID=1070528 RepID=A0A6C0K1P9_9ZZZZ